MKSAIFDVVLRGRLSVSVWVAQVRVYQTQLASKRLHLPYANRCQTDSVLGWFCLVF